MIPRAEEAVFFYGCITLLVVLLVGGAMLYYGTKSFLGSMVMEYTDTKPESFPAVVFTSDEGQELIQRVEAFRQALLDGTPTAPLVLSARDLNVLMSAHPELKPISGHAFLTIDDDLIGGSVSIPLKEFGYEGRFLNGSGAIKISLSDGYLLARLHHFALNGKDVPEEQIEQIKQQNLAKNVRQENPEISDMLDKLESIEVRGGLIRIVPKMLISAQ